MNSAQFQLHKVQRAIGQFGTVYVFNRDNLNEYKEPDGTFNEVVTLKGLWHESQGYITTTNSDSSTVRSKPSLQLMSLWVDAKDIEQGDFLLIDKTRYNVTGVHNLADAGIVADISLEVVV